MDQIQITKSIKSLCAIFFLILVSCGGKVEEGESSTVDVDQFTNYLIDIEASTVAFTELIKEVEVVRLEETEESLLGNIRRLKVEGDHLLFPGDNGDFFVYSYTGEFIRKINKKGDGPEEYRGIMDFWIEKDTLAIYSRPQIKVIRYGLEGNFIDSYSLPYQASHVIGFENRYLLDMNQIRLDSLQYNLIVVDPNSGKETFLSPFSGKSQFTMFNEASVFASYGNGHIYTRILSDTVLFVNDDGVEPLMSFDFGEEWLWDHEGLVSNSRQVFSSIDNEGKVWTIHPKIGNDFIYLSYQTSFSSLHQVLINRRSGELMAFNLRKTIEENFLMMPIAWYGDQLLMSMQSTDVTDFLGSFDSNQIEFREGTTVEGIESSENPVLVWIKFN